jgi:hypothetical protein
MEGDLTMFVSVMVLDFGVEMEGFFTSFLSCKSSYNLANASSFSTNSWWN